MLVAAIPMGVILAIDYGVKRLGLALSDADGITCQPFATWTRINRRRDVTRLRELARQRGVERIVVGLPLHLDGTPSAMSEQCRAFGQRIERALGIPVDMVDERLSSWEAEQIVAKSKVTTRVPGRDAHRTNPKRRAALDHVAAAVILRDYLDRRHLPAESGD